MYVGMAASSSNVVSTAPLHGYQVIFSPYTPHKLAFVGAHNYGIAGRGGLILFEEGGDGGQGLREMRRYIWRDGLFDVTWSEVNEAILVAAAGDGGLLVFDQNLSSDAPAMVLPGHTAEVSSVQWSVTRQEQLVVSSSWDGTVRLWDPHTGSCLSVFPDHTGMVYSACWSPHLPHTFGSVSGDGTLRLWDSTSPSHCTAFVHSHAGELLACDWSKYDPNLLFTAGVDTNIRLWDIRQLSGPVVVMGGHTQAVRRIKCDPFRGNIIATCSYDFTVRTWDISRQERGYPPLLETISHHAEFTFGLDMCSLACGKMADCSWDRTLKIYFPLSLAETQQP